MFRLNRQNKHSSEFNDDEKKKSMEIWPYEYQFSLCIYIYFSCNAIQFNSIYSMLFIDSSSSSSAAAYFFHSSFSHLINALSYSSFYFFARSLHFFRIHRLLFFLCVGFRGWNWYEWGIHAWHLRENNEMYSTCFQCAMNWKTHIDWT